MDSPKEIATGMLEIFSHRKRSKLETFSYGFISGFMDIPEDLWMVTKDFLDSDHRWRNENDRIRLITMIKKGVTSEDVRKLVSIIIRKYLSGLSEDQGKALFTKISGKMLGSVSFKMVFVNELIALFVMRVIPQFLLSAGMTGVLSIGAGVSRSIYKSYELKKINQEIYNELRGAGDLDLLYFLVESNVEPFLKAINYQSGNSEVDNQIFNHFLSGVNCA